MLHPSIIEAYDARRDFSNKSFRSGCYAPYVSMLFDQWGNVRVCCQNYSDLLGNVSQTRLKEIWHGEAYERLRRAVDEYRFDGGCSHCKWQILDGDYTGAYASHFESYSVDSRQQPMPQLMEFNLSNACNLECIMCNAEFSSSIRSRRDHLSPLPHFYGESFFEDLRPMLPGIKVANCIGGEPFLVKEMYRIWDMMIEDGLKTRCHISTNCTVYNAKVERVLEHLPCTFQMSIDGITKETFEKIRVGANFERAMEIFHKLRDYSRSREGHYFINFCLLRQNWRELGKILLFGDEQDCAIAINPVVLPADVSLYTLPREELAQVVDALEAEEATLLPQLGRNREVWIQQLDRLRNRFANMDGPKPLFASLRLNEPFPEPIKTSQDAATTAQSATVDLLSKWSDNKVATLVSDQNDIVVDILGAEGGFLDFPKDECLGRRTEVVVSRYRELFGGGTEIDILEESRDRVDRIFTFFGPFRPDTGRLRAVTLPRVDNQGELIGSYLIATLKLEPSPAATL
ncbi:MAG: radical SAM protein [Planctomycetota bacterium]